MKNGSLKAAGLVKRKGKLKMLQDLLKNYKVFYKLWLSCHDLVTARDISTSIVCAYHVLNALTSPSYQKFHALQSLREKTIELLPDIQQLADKALDLISCRRFDACQYGSIVQTNLIFDYMRENFGLYVVAKTGIEDLPYRVFKYQLADIENCLRSSVMEIIYKQSGSQDVGKLLSLPDLEFTLLYQNVNSESCMPCLLRNCEGRPSSYLCQSPNFV